MLAPGSYSCFHRTVNNEKALVLVEKALILYKHDDLGEDKALYKDQISILDGIAVALLWKGLFRCESCQVGVRLYRG